jgi:hypothetical protein
VAYQSDYAGVFLALDVLPLSLPVDEVVAGADGLGEGAAGVVDDPSFGVLAESDRESDPESGPELSDPAVGAVEASASDPLAGAPVRLSVL